MSDITHTINAIRNVPHSELHCLIKTVAVILCSPRSGSSLVKDVLALHPDISSLDGEIEPFLTLTKNGFGFNSDSDAIDLLDNKVDLVDNILDDLTVSSSSECDVSFLIQKWQKRLLLQFPTVFSEEQAYERLNNTLQDVLVAKNTNDYDESRCFEKNILINIYKDEPWRLNYYDGIKAEGAIRYFDEEIKIEEPPFVVPKNNRRPFREIDAGNKILLFKAPPDVYRIGMYEKLFPNAKVHYIHLTRGYASTVNGLMDGWLSPVGFFSHDLRGLGLALDIKGYSDTVPFGKWWWKFDLPPNWQKYSNKQLEDVCLNQWMSAHKAVLEGDVKTLRVSFEDFLVSPNVVLRKIERYLGLCEVQRPHKLPVKMATASPELKRWVRRKDLLLPLADCTEVVQMMAALDYEMDLETWL